MVRQQVCLSICPLQATLHVTLKSEISRPCFIHIYMVQIMKLKTKELKRDTFSRLTQNEIEK